jgi:hypothetical protein
MILLNKYSYFLYVYTPIFCTWLYKHITFLILEYPFATEPETAVWMFILPRFTTSKLLWIVLLHNSIHVQKKFIGLEAVLLREFIKQLASLLALVDETLSPDSCSDSVLKFKNFDVSYWLLCKIFLSHFLPVFEGRLTNQFRFSFDCFCFCLFLWRLDSFAMLFRGIF